MGLHNDDNPVKETTTSERDLEAIELKLFNSSIATYEAFTEWSINTKREELLLIGGIMNELIDQCTELDEATKEKFKKDPSALPKVYEEVQNFVNGEKIDLDKGLIMKELSAENEEEINEEEIDEIIKWANEEKINLGARDLERSSIMKKKDVFFADVKDYEAEVSKENDILGEDKISVEMANEAVKNIDEIKLKDRNTLTTKDFKNCYIAALGMLKYSIETYEGFIKKRIESHGRKKQKKDKSVGKTIDRDELSRKPKTNDQKETKTSEQDKEAIKLKLAKAFCELDIEVRNMCWEIYDDEEALLKKLIENFVAIPTRVSKYGWKQEKAKSKLIEEIKPKLREFVEGTKSDLDINFFSSALKYAHNDAVEKFIQWAHKEREKLVSKDKERNSLENILSKSNPLLKEYKEKFYRGAPIVPEKDITVEKGEELEDSIDTIREKNRNNVEFTTEDFEHYYVYVRVLLERHYPEANNRVQSRIKNSDLKKQKKGDTQEKTQASNDHLYDPALHLVDLSKVEKHPEKEEESKPKMPPKNVKSRADLKFLAMATENCEEKRKVTYKTLSEARDMIKSSPTNQSEYKAKKEAKAVVGEREEQDNWFPQIERSEFLEKTQHLRGKGNLSPTSVGGQKKRSTKGKRRFPGREA